MWVKRELNQTMTSALRCLESLSNLNQILTAYRSTMSSPLWPYRKQRESLSPLWPYRKQRESHLQHTNKSTESACVLLLSDPRQTLIFLFTLHVNSVKSFVLAAVISTSFLGRLSHISIYHIIGEAAMPIIC